MYVPLRGQYRTWVLAYLIAGLSKPLVCYLDSCTLSLKVRSVCKQLYEVTVLIFFLSGLYLTHYDSLRPTCDSSIPPCNSNDYVYIWDQVVEGWRQDKALGSLLIFWYHSSHSLSKGVSLYQSFRFLFVYFCCHCHWSVTVSLQSVTDFSGGGDLMVLWILVSFPKLPAITYFSQFLASCSMHCVYGLQLLPVRKTR